MKKGYFIYVGFALSILFFLINVNYSVAFAAGQTDINTILKNGTSGGIDRTVPQGLTNIGQWFSKPDINGNNNTEVLPANTNTGGINNQSDSDVIMLTKLGDNYKTGAIWSKRDQSDVDDRNYIDINKKQTMSMWMFFGGIYRSGNSENTGDGMAFVLQNESDSAFTTLVGGKNSPGETLGVWGSPYAASDTSQTLASRAIQNSWAMEFDTYPNIDSTFDSAFDNFSGAGYSNHIGNNYPALASTYVPTSKGMTLNHRDAIGNVKTADKPSNFLTDDRWHHLSLTWNPAVNNNSAYITFDYDDKTIDGQSKAGERRTIPIDTANFNLKSGENKLYWGFTGSTGESTENNLIVFESIPAIVEADATSSIVDESAGNHVLSDPTSTNENANVVHDGDSVSVNYNLNYLSGSKPWENIKAKIKLPEQVSYNSALITYTKKDGSTQTENIDGIKGVPTDDITHILAQSLYKDDIVSANIKFEGTVTSTNKENDSPVSSAHAEFYGSNLKKDVMTTAFVIKQPVKIKLAKIESSPEISVGQEAKLQGTVSYSDNSTVDPSKLVVVAKVNDGDPVKVNMDTIATTGTFSLPVSTDLFSDLHEGDNTVQIYVYNTDDFNISDPISFEVKVTGSLQIKAAQLSHFNSIQATKAKRLISRSSDWSVDIEDSRSIGDKWYLFAEATPLTKNDDTWNGGLVYVNKNNEEKTLTNNKVAIDSGVKDKEGLQETDIDQKWSSDTGILLRQNSYEEAGTYSSTIVWTAQDSI